ncbi:MAG TPA: AAA family ATPase [Spirochaetia bacterium]|nr:AAA family ATPase [Spirochaetia bacterium]
MGKYARESISGHLRRNMVFVAGAPRQVGKTTLARSVLGAEDAYLSWDIAEHRERIQRGEWPLASTLALDEIHKYRSWRALPKGLWDSRDLRSEGAIRRLLVTGSGRLDLYRYGGDSLQGRYHLLRLHPFSYAELAGAGRGDLEALFEIGGVPEPFLSGSKTEARRSSRDYRYLESIVDLGKLELLTLRLPELVGSPLSVNSLREDLQVAHKTVESWLSALERLYALFRIEPFGAPRLRAVKKERKHYLFDWTFVNDPPAASRTT